MATRIEIPEGPDALEEFLLFHDRVYGGRPARWEANLDLQRPFLSGESPFAKERASHAVLARERGEIVARAVAVADPRYNRHWNEELGHIVWFEALPGAEEASRRVLDEACAWLAGQGLRAARVGFSTPALDFPLVMDAYDSLPPSMLRQNPASYHTLLKQAGFEVEQGFVDYKLHVTPERIERWESSLESALRSGFEILPLEALPRSERIAQLTDLWNDTFRAHWGWSRFSEDEVGFLLDEMAQTTVLETSVLAHHEGRPVGFVFNAADDPDHAVFQPGRRQADSERLNTLAIGVREAARGRGVNYAMAAFSYLELVRRGQTHLSYTLVLDHNWPSRRTGEGLGASICANYLAYRRNFRR